MFRERRGCMREALTGEEGMGGILVVGYRVVWVQSQGVTTLQ